MALPSKIRRWRNVAHFSASRLSDYASLAAVEFDLARKHLVRDVILYSLLGLSVMFGLAFVCVAVIVSAAGTPYLTETAWAVAAFWALASIGSFVVVRLRNGSGAFSVLTEELQRDIQTIRESLQ
jgi:uncharacterized membrane protein YqjE